ncbi:putative S-adenosyl-L-methionine dependent methyltransferase [Blattamonas nauphoetae]|uniref:S-adenosyl-L-methionine dependent methyltransferase n=1 Tax=Blattamonas nauphoetae TaxID=2049346 RepID=A0ABQ9WNL9_9EUKA|nr:putative S-adenosyl-L-methionine dependent methyltransferase [Blattamonas nauphoetae]
MPNYGSVDYWNDRYTQSSEPFEWYQDYTAISTVLGEFIQPEQKILFIGCGTSVIPSELNKAGFTDIDCVDFSEVAIAAMQERYEGLEGLRFTVGDATSLSNFEAESFDVIIDKACLDAQICGHLEKDIANAILTEVNRLLKPGAIFLEITYGEPERRHPYLERSDLGWTIEDRPLPRPVVTTETPAVEGRENHFLYICTKPIPEEAPEEEVKEGEAEDGGEKEGSGEQDEAEPTEVQEGDEGAAAEEQGEGEEQTE